MTILFWCILAIPFLPNGSRYLDSSDQGATFCPNDYKEQHKHWTEDSSTLPNSETINSETQRFSKKLEFLHNDRLRHKIEKCIKVIFFYVVGKSYQIFIV